MTHSYERYSHHRFVSSPPDNTSNDSSSPYLDSLAPSSELPEGGEEAVGLSQGDSGAPSAFVLLVGPLRLLLWRARLIVLVVMGLYWTS